MKVGILGSGDVARSLGAGFVEVGHTVKLGTRTPSSPPLQAWLKKTGTKATAGSPAEAAKFGEWVVLAVHGVDAPRAIELADPKNLAGKIVIDVTNPLLFPTGAPPPVLSVGFNDSNGEIVQRLLPKSHVVKAFNIVGHLHMFRPKFPSGPPDMFYCGNDAESKEKVKGLLTEFGWNPIDIGGIEGARLLEPMCVLWVTAALKIGSWDVAWKLIPKS